MNSTLTYGSVCSGMEAATLAWAPLGWKCAFVSEIEKAPCALLKERYPDVPNFGDMTKFEEWPDVAIDVLAGGTPCQAFSIAGLRRGLTDPRGSLMLTYGAIAKRYRPTWLFWENVPGVLSSDGGRDFGAFLGMLAELGYGFAHRILDAQYFGLAQRRARVFVVGYLGDWRPPAAVLFERESLRGDSAPSRQTGEGIAPTIAARTKGGGGLGTDAECDGALIPELARCVTAHPAHPARIDGESETFIAGTLNTSVARGTGAANEDTFLVAHTLLAKEHSSHAADVDTYVAHSLRADGFDASEDGTGRGTPLIAFSSKDHGADAGEIAPTLRAMGHDGSHANAGGQAEIAYNITPSNSNKDYNARQSERAQAVTTQSGAPSARGGDVVVEELAVRRLTPRECERLQGAPDDHTQVTYRKKPMADGPRYKMIGNSWAVPVVRWIGERVALVDARLKAERADCEVKEGEL